MRLNFCSDMPRSDLIDIKAPATADRAKRRQPTTSSSSSGDVITQTGKSHSTVTGLIATQASLASLRLTDAPEHREQRGDSDDNDGASQGSLESIESQSMMDLITPKR